VEDAADTAAQTVEPAAGSSPPAAPSEAEPAAPTDTTPPSDSAER